MAALTVHVDLSKEVLGNMTDYISELEAILDTIVSRVCTCGLPYMPPAAHEDNCEYRAIASSD